MNRKDKLKDEPTNNSMISWYKCRIESMSTNGNNTFSSK